jgi:hypothetical protein
MAELLSCLDEGSAETVTAHAPAGMLSAWLQLGCTQGSAMDPRDLVLAFKVGAQDIECDCFAATSCGIAAFLAPGAVFRMS